MASRKKSEAETPPAHHAIPTVLDRVRARMRADLADRIARSRAALDAQAEAYAAGSASLAGFLADVATREASIADDEADLAHLDGQTPPAGCRVGPILARLSGSLAKVAPPADAD